VLNPQNLIQYVGLVVDQVLGIQHFNKKSFFSQSLDLEENLKDENELRCPKIKCAKSDTESNLPRIFANPFTQLWVFGTGVYIWRILF
jgi:hypothetical protein